MSGVEVVEPAAAEAGSGTPGEARGAGRLGRNLAALGLGQLFTWTMTLAWTLVVPRVLGPSGLGLIVTAMSVTGILQIVLSMGTSAYVARSLVVDRDRSSELLSTAVTLHVLLGPLFFAGTVVWAHFAHFGHDGTLVLYLVAGATFLTMLAEPIQSAFQAIEKMQYLAITDAINKSAQGLLGIALALAGLGAVGFAGCWMVMAGVVVLLSVTGCAGSSRWSSARRSGRWSRW